MEDISLDNNFGEKYDKLCSEINRLVWEAKYYILNNYQDIENWSQLRIRMAHGRTPPRFDYESEFYRPKNGRLLASGKVILPANPVVSVANAVLDNSDGDFSITVNGREWWWIPDNCVITIAQYIEEHLNNKKGVD
jgi:hypothetical protein